MHAFPGLLPVAAVPDDWARVVHALAAYSCRDSRRLGKTPAAFPLEPSRAPARINEIETRISLGLNIPLWMQPVKNKAAHARGSADAAP
jgi:hypothetical protein